MAASPLLTWARANEALAIVTIAAVIAVSLFSFEYVTGLPASLRGDPTYNMLSLPGVRGTRQRPARPSLREKRLQQRMQQNRSSAAAR